MSNKDNKQLLANEIEVWYAKLAKSGFEDIENYKNKRAHSSNSPYIKQDSSLIPYKYKAATAEHYRICTHYCTNGTFKLKKHKYIFELYSDGMTFRDILKHLRVNKGGWYYSKKGYPLISLFSLHHLIKKLIKDAYEYDKKESLANND